MSHSEQMNPPRPLRFTRFYLLALLPLAAALGGGLAYHEFVVHAILTNIVINALILGTALVGVMLMLFTIRGVARESHGFDRLARAPLDTTARTAIGSLLGARLLAHVDDLRGMRLSLIDQSHIHGEMSELREGLNARQELGQYLVGLMVALGLLGTFIGLLETLVGVGALIGSFGKGSGDLESSFQALLGNLQKPLAAMGTAFAASMFGLIGSLLLGLVQIVVRSAQARFVDHAHGIISTLIEVNDTVGGDLPARNTDPAALAAVVDTMLAAQRGLVDEVRILQEEGRRNEARVGALGDTVQALAGIAHELATLSARDVETRQAIAALPAGFEATRQALDGMAGRLDASTGAVLRWQDQSDRRQAVALRHFTRLARTNAARLDEASATFRDAQRDALARIAEEQAREERRGMRDGERLRTAMDAAVEMLRAEAVRGRLRDDALVALAARQDSGQDAVLERLDRLVAVARQAPVADGEDIRGLLRRLDAFEQRLSRDLHDAARAARLEAGAA